MFLHAIQKFRPILRQGLAIEIVSEGSEAHKRDDEDKRLFYLQSHKNVTTLLLSLRRME